MFFSFLQNLIRNALFGNFFGVLALQQSGRLSKVSAFTIMYLFFYTVKTVKCRRRMI